MKKRLLILFLVPTIAFAQTWKQAPLQLATKWAKEVSPTNALKEYPRPQMVRSNWQNLKGLWEYAITDKNVVASRISFLGAITRLFSSKAVACSILKVLPSISSEE